MPPPCLYLTFPSRLRDTVVKTQVASQIKVRDLSRATVTAAPAQFSSWNEARCVLAARTCVTACV